VDGEIVLSDNFDSYTTHKFDRASLEQYEREQAMSLGKDRVRINFNPSADNLVDTIKQATANLIDLCDQNCDSGAGTEERRLWALAMTYYETASMYAVKAATARQTGQTSVTRAVGI